MILATLNRSLLLLVFLAILGAVPVANAYYEPGIQRWINRDPINEQGGSNLYGFVRNRAINRIDPFGWTDQNRPPVLINADGKVKYGYPGCLPPDQCAALLGNIMRKTAELAADLAKYDPVADGIGGFPKHGGGTTIPGGHYMEILQRQQGIKNDIAKYIRACIQGGNGGNPSVPSYVDELANREVEPPHVPILINIPIPMPSPSPIPVPVPVP